MTQFNYRTACKRLAGDMVTPVSAYLRLRDAYPQSALLESSDFHSRENSKSFIALHPIASVSIAHGTGKITMPDGETRVCGVASKTDAANLVNGFLRLFRITGEGADYCGLYGYTSFNAVKYFEGIDVKDETQPENDAPDMLYILYKNVIVFDHFRSEITIVQLPDEGETDSIAEIERDIAVHPCRSYAFRTEGPCRSTLTDDEHRANIRRGIASCLRGDVFQIVLSRRFTQRFSGDDFNLYRALRIINPSPYLFYFDFGGFRIFGSSPETHCRIAGRRAFIDPIAGTTRRTGDAEDDQRNALYLQNDPKENAEHVMLVDLARNDLSRNCRNVRVEFYKEMQYYSHVIHLVSRVAGELDDGADPVAAFVDTFPAGTLSGAPKVRAMQLISQWEPHNRGAYGGCIGFIGFNGDLNQAITIRTFVSRGGELWFQAGGGIVAKSDVEYELQEVNNKLGALRKAMEKAEEL